MLQTHLGHEEFCFIFTFAFSQEFIPEKFFILYELL